MTEGAPDAFLLHIATSALGGGSPPRHIGLAVSGGGDSMALLWLIAPWARDRKIEVSVATVDHGLRPEAGDEARFVAEICAGLGVSHTTLHWSGWNGRGNLQAAAREGRRELLASWARESDIDTILLGHTEDDQAETMLMRLARGSGIDGLSGMAAFWHERGVAWLRPLLLLGRQELRDFLRRHERAWVEDPSNDDRNFARVRAREALACLSDLGITPSRLGEAAGRIQEARWALERFAEQTAERLVTIRLGDVVISYCDPMWLPTEIQFRLWTGAIRWVSGAPYRPRRRALLDAQARTCLDGRRSLGGTLIRFRGKGRSRELIIGREPRAAARAAPVPTTALWDGRWRLSGPHAPDLEVRMLGEAGLALCPDWREMGLERSSVLASPAVWRGSVLVAAPVAGRPEGWTAEAVPDFHSFLRSGR